MKITVTIEEIMQKDVWMEFCQLTGISEWARAEGQIPDGETFTLTLEEAQQLGLLPKDKEEYR